MPANGEIAGWIAGAAMLTLWAARAVLLVRPAFRALSRPVRGRPLLRLSAADRRWLAALHVKWSP